MAAGDAVFPAFLFTATVARIVVRGDNRPPNHAYHHHLGGPRCRSPPMPAIAGAEPVQPNVTSEAEVVVTATREPRDSLITPASVTRIGGDALAELSAKHQAEALNRGAGVYIQRGSGAESLAAIRSPVLTGAGACGAFLVAEDNLPIRPVGFCNLNEMFELNYEQAGAIEVLRGPGSAMYGASAVHGIVNVLTPRVGRPARFSAGVEGGSDSFKRVRLGAAQRVRRLGHRRLRLGHARAGLARCLGRRRGQAQSTRRRRGRRRHTAPARRGHDAQPGNRGVHPGLRQLSRRSPRAQQSQSRGVSRRLERARLRAFPARQLLRTRLPLRARRASIAARAWISCSTS